ncbi:hypothetical protein F4801DRAFT_598730 [Xylaria longipes]|nr:hypothetical protein F4801DRAFT_598730 [Xylaria longipes]
MSTATHHRDASASQTIFLNFENPSNDASLCYVRQDAMKSLLKILGLTPGFILSLKSQQKRAIIFLASYAVDWRSCVKEYNDIALCFGRLPKGEKALISGLGQVDCEPLDHAQHIRLDRIQPNIVHLHQKSYHLNRGISTVAPPGVVVPPTTGPRLFTVAAPVPSHPPQLNGQVLPAPATASGSALALATTTTAAAVAGGGAVSSSTPPGGQASAVAVGSGTSGAVTQNDSSSGIAVGSTGATGGVGTTDNGQQDNQTDAERLPDAVDKADSDANSIPDDLSKAASGSASDSSAENGDEKEEIKEDVQDDAHMQVDDDNSDDNETDPSAELDEKEVKNHDTAPIADGEDEDRPSKKRKLHA